MKIPPLPQDIIQARIVVLISGSGSNLQAILDLCKDNYHADVVAVISNRPGVKGLERARKAGVQALTLDHTHYDTREEFDEALRHLIDAQRPELVVLAGFMRILTPGFVERYLGRMINIHPSLLPKYQGLHTHKRAIEAGDKEHGATVHYVTAELDGGPGILQAKVPILAGDTPEDLAQRVLAQEHLIYPKVIEWYANGDLQHKRGKAYYQGKEIPVGGLKYNP